MIALYQTVRPNQLLRYLKAVLNTEARRHYKNNKPSWGKTLLILLFEYIGPVHHGFYINMGHLAIMSNT